ncbi:hypothetical protein D6C92_05752 [Aureobasidium pullulans]|nr:hypothetical protein D6C92_05752 [Aureobasidium pullulans]
MNDLKSQLSRLDLSHYHDTFVDEGFDTWETLMDITEADLEVLGVKLGHRRKLQRAIFNASKDRTPLPSPFRSSHVDESAGQDDSKKGRDSQSHQDGHQNQHNAGQTNGAPQRSKRKYRRHPKPDEHAPERPPSAYVIFSNQIRDQLRGKDLSFTEIAKLVGERWQELQAHEKEPCEREAQTLKDKYYSELRKYKKTPQYKEYQEYLIDFKAKHSESNHQENFKKPKLQKGGSQNRSWDESVADGDDRGDGADGVDDVDGNDGVEGEDGTHDRSGSPPIKAPPSPTNASPNVDSFRLFPLPKNAPPSDEGTVSSYSAWRSSTQPSLPLAIHRQMTNTTATTQSDDGSQSPSSSRLSYPATRSSGPPKPSTTTLPPLSHLDSMSSRKSSDATPLLNWPLHTTLPPIDPRGIGQHSAQATQYSSPTSRRTPHPPHPLHPPPLLPLKDSQDLDLQNKASLSTLLRATKHVERDGTRSSNSSHQGSSRRTS